MTSPVSSSRDSLSSFKMAASGGQGPSELSSKWGRGQRRISTQQRSVSVPDLLISEPSSSTTIYCPGSLSTGSLPRTFQGTFSRSRSAEDLVESIRCDRETSSEEAASKDEISESVNFVLSEVVDPDLEEEVSESSSSVSLNSLLSELSDANIYDENIQMVDGNVRLIDEGGLGSSGAGGGISRASRENSIVLDMVPALRLAQGVCRRGLYSYGSVDFLGRQGQSGFLGMGIAYVNGGLTTIFDAEQESMHLSECLLGAAVRLFYNSGGSFCPRIMRNLGMARPPANHPLVIELLEEIESFFQREGPLARYLIVFYGDGGGFVQHVIDQTRYSNRITVLGVSPRLYVSDARSGASVSHVRVLGDVFSLLDWRGRSHARVQTVSYSHNSVLLTTPSFTDAAFVGAIRRVGFTLFGRTLVTSILDSADNNSSAEEGSPVAESATFTNDFLIAGESISTRIVRDRATLVLYSDQELVDYLLGVAEGSRTNADMRVSYLPQNLVNRVAIGLSLMARANEIVLDTLMLPFDDGADLVVSQVLVAGYSLALAGNGIILLTNALGAGSSGRYRRLRLLGQVFISLEQIVTLTDFSVFLQGVLDTTGCIAGYYQWWAGSLFIFILHEQVLPLFPSLYGRIQALSLRALREEDYIDEASTSHGVEVRRRALQIGDYLQSLFVGGAFIAFVNMGSGFLGVPLHGRCRLDPNVCEEGEETAVNSTCNNSTVPNSLAELFRPLNNDVGGTGLYETGVASAIGHAEGLFFNAILFCLYAYLIIRLVVSYRRNRFSRL